MPPYVQLQHAVLEHALVGGGGGAGTEDPLSLAHPVLELLVALGEEVMFPHDALDPGGLVLKRSGQKPINF